jgi:DNA-directed RNA polymerase III subunit RPC6
MGIWKRDVRNQVSIEVKELTKLLNSLEKRNIIKKVGTSVKARYMLSTLQPDRSITGGAFYEGDRFDKELVEVNIATFPYLS